MIKDYKEYIVAYGKESDLLDFLDGFVSAMRETDRNLRFFADLYNSEKDISHMLIEYENKTPEEFPELDNILSKSDKLKFVFASHVDGKVPSVTVNRFDVDVGSRLCMIVMHFGKVRASGDYEERKIGPMDGLVQEMSNDPNLAFAFELLGYPLSVLESASDNATH